MADKPTLVAQMDFPKGQAVSLDINAFDDAIRSQGLVFVHFRAMRCPVGLVDRYDNRRPNHDHSGCSNGFIYTEAGQLTALATGNSKNPREIDTGFIDGSTMQVTAQRFYDDTRKEVHVAPFDRFYLDEPGIVVPTWQLFEANITGVDKMQFPVVEVQELMDSSGNVYRQDEDFVVKGGYIHWTGSRPAYDAAAQRGSVCAIRYLYRPYWYVKQLLHQVRVTQSEDPRTGARAVHRMPQAMVLQREYVFERDESTPPGEDNPRQVPAPPEGAFGPR